MNWSDWDAENNGFEYEHGVGLTIARRVPRWLSWDETIALHKWLSEKIKQLDEPGQ